MRFLLPTFAVWIILFIRMAEVPLAAELPASEPLPVAPPESSFFLGGIQVNEANHDQWAKTVRAIGMNTIEVTVYAKQGDWDSDNLWYDDVDKGVLTEIKAARKQGLKIVLILRVSLDHAYERNKFLWHGMILPKNEELLNSWFQKYSTFVSKWAKIAAKEGVHVLAIGSELNALSATIQLDEIPHLYRYFNSNSAQSVHEKRVLKFEKQLEQKHLWVRGNDNYETLELFIEDKIAAHQLWAKQITYDGHDHPMDLMNKRRGLVQSHWEKIIADTRQTFSGKLTYAANFDNYFDVGFWKSLDFIGINAYFPLRDPNMTYLTKPGLKTALLEGWKKVFSDINEFKLTQDVADKPLFFTELGYIYRTNTTIEPWSGFGFSVVGSTQKEWLIVWREQAINRKERAMAVDALHEVVKAQNIDLAGILYWKLTTHVYHIDVEPFVLHIATKATDELQYALTQFAR